MTVVNAKITCASGHMQFSVVVTGQHAHDDDILAGDDVSCNAADAGQCSTT